MRNILSHWDLTAMPILMRQGGRRNSSVPCRPNGARNSRSEKLSRLQCARFTDFERPDVAAWALLAKL